MIKRKVDPIKVGDPRIVKIFTGLVEEKTISQIAKEIGVTLDQARRCSEKYNLQHRAEVARQQSLELLKNELTTELGFKLIDSMSLLQPKLLELGEQVDNILKNKTLDDGDVVKTFLRMLELHAKISGADKSQKDETNVNLVYTKVMEAADKMSINVESAISDDDMDLIE